MKYPEPLAHLLSFIPDDVYADKEKEITEIADAIAKDRARLKEAVLELTTGEEYCGACERYQERHDGPHEPNCIVRQLLEEPAE